MPAGRPLIDHCFGELKRWLSFGPKAAHADISLNDSRSGDASDSTRTVEKMPLMTLAESKH